MNKGPLIIFLAVTATLLAVVSFSMTSYFQNKNSNNFENFNLPNNSDFEFTFLTYPVDLPAKPQGAIYAKQNFYPEMNYLEVDKDIWVTEIIPRVENAPPETLHHGAIFFEGINDEYCTKSQKLFFSSSKEMTPLITPQGYGFFIPKGTKLTTFARYMHFRNDTENEYKNATYNVKIKGTTIKSKKLIPLDIFWLNAECSTINEFIFPVPANRKSSKTLAKPYIADSNFEFVIMASHIHDFGEKLDFKINDEIIWTFTPILEGDVIKTIPLHTPTEPIQVNEGDKLDIEAFYDNKTKNVTEGMAMFIGFISRD